MQDPRILPDDVQMRKTLQKENNLYRNALDHEVDDLKEQAKTIGKYALIGGAALIGTYLLVKYLNKSEKETEYEEPQKRLMNVPQAQVVVEKPVPVAENSFFSLIKEQLAMMLITVIREKLAEITGVEKKKLEQKQDELTGKA
jgi:hypothetical protein